MSLRPNLRPIPCLAAAFAVLCAAFAAADLKTYVEAADPSYGYAVVKQEPMGAATRYILKMTSQTWRGMAWWHWVDVIVPAEIKHPETALLLIDGGDNDNPDALPGGGEVPVLARVAEVTGTVTARVSQVPNQPLFGGKSEDEIISYTYDQYLRSGDATWPLLFPMVKSATAAMTAVQDLAKKERGIAIAHFMPTGGSKRGWTSWLAAAVDPRVKAVAPFVIDTLNMPEQTRHMMATYGGYSEEIADYTAFDLQARMASPEGHKLTAMVDPYFYRDRLKLPKLVVLGTNDPYWTVDAANLYFPALEGEKHLYYQANTAHDTNLDGIAALTNFYNGVVTGEKFPALAWKQPSPNALDVAWDRPGGTAQLWTAASPNRDFRGSVWSSAPLEGDGKTFAEVKTPASGWAAYYVEVRFPGAGGLPFGVTTPITVLPDAFPTTGRAYDPQAAGEKESE